MLLFLYAEYDWWLNGRVFAIITGEVQVILKTKKLVIYLISLVLSLRVR